jgi:Flp pilus assembly protein TadG
MTREIGHTEQDHAHHRRAGPRRGQTLVEFALTLPILLMLLFGIIEFGRIFQAWVTIQNAARTAVRYAVTGQYDDKEFTINNAWPNYPPEVDYSTFNTTHPGLPCPYLNTDPAGQQFKDHWAAPIPGRMNFWLRRTSCAW